jgi:hypothetical protein
MRAFFAPGKPSPAMIVACVALFLSLGGVGYAAATIGSAQIKNNSVKSADIRNGTVLSKDISRATRKALKGQIGPQGLQGLQGPKGDQGLPATKLWARVSGAGALLDGSGVTGVNRTAAGRYNVTFNQDVSHCAAVSTSDFRGLGDGWGVFTDQGTPPDANTVRVLTSLNTSNTVDQPFDVAVFC